MTKNDIYQGAIFYQQNISAKKLAPSNARYFRDTFKPLVDLGIQIEKDRLDLVEKFKEVEDKTELTAELDTLFKEEVVVAKLPEDFFTRLENAGIEITTSDLTLLEKLS